MAAGRPQLLKDSDTVFLSGISTKSLLQKVSLRRAIVDHLVDVGGSATVGDINRKFKFECRSHIGSLIKAGWLQKKGLEQCQS